MHFGGRSWSKKHCKTAGILQSRACENFGRRIRSTFLGVVAFQALGLQKNIVKRQEFCKEGRVDFSAPACTPLFIPPILRYTPFIAYAHASQLQPCPPRFAMRACYP